MKISIIKNNEYPNMPAITRSRTLYGSRYFKIATSFHKGNSIILPGFLVEVSNKKPAGIIMINNKTDKLKFMISGIKNQRNNPSMSYMNDAFNRLAKDGYREEDILEMCMWVTAAEYFRMMAFQQNWDINRYKDGINRLPLMPWEDNGDDYFADVTQEDINDGVFDNPNFTMETAEQIKQRYQDFRAIFISIQKVMSPLLNEDIFLSSACELGIINNDNTPKSFSKETTAIIADHCVYANMKQRKKLINTVRSRHSRYLDSKHRAMLDAMEKTKYMILICKEAIPGIGVQVKNMLTGEVIRLMDINLSKQAEPGMTICSHIVEIEDIFMTTGAGLPIITNEALQEINGIVKQYLDKYAGLPSDVITKYNGEFATKIICTLLRQEAMERTRYK